MDIIEKISITLPENSRNPKYRQLADGLSRWIAENKPEPGSRLPSERSLAESCGTSAITVSKGLNLLVQKGILTRKGGSGSYIAAGDSSRHGLLRIGMLAHEIIKPDDCYISEVLRSFTQYWQERSADVISLVRQPEEYMQAMREYNLAGILVIDPQESFTGKIKELLDAGMPLVTLGIRIPEFADASFGTDHEKICEEAVAYLVSRGHRRIGLLANSDIMRKSSVTERENGYRRGMWNARLPVNPDWLIRAKLQNDDHADLEMFRRLFCGSEAPTAILAACHSDVQPLYLLMKKLKLRIPQDISVLAFDDPYYGKSMTPPLSVFMQPVAKLALNAARQLEQKITGKPMLHFPFEEAVLVARKSVSRLS